MVSLFSFLILVELCYLSLHVVWCWLLAYLTFPLLCLGMYPVFLIFSRDVTWRGDKFCHSSFQYLMWCSCVFFPLNLFICWITLMDFHILDHIYISGVESTRSCVMMLVFYALLVLVCKYFEYFCINIHKRNWYEIILLYISWVFMWFMYQGDCGLIEWVCLCSFCFNFIE